MRSISAPATWPEVVSDDSITRGLWGAGLEIVGPKFYRVFERPSSDFSPQYKHSVEPSIIYGYQEGYDRADDIILYDEVDRFSGAGEQLAYGIVQRLFAKRPQTQPTAPPGPADRVVLPDGTTSEVVEPAPTKNKKLSEPVEIATLTLRQSRSLDQSLSFADLDGDGVNETESRSSDVQLVGRFNPSPRTSFDVRSNYHVLYNNFSSITMSGSIRRELARLRFSVVHRNGLGVQNVGTISDPIFQPIDDDTQIRLTTGFTMLGGRLRLDLDGSFDADPAPGQRHIPDKRWRLQYSTQCCTFLFERLARDFAASSDRRDFYFRVDLKGVGKLLDFKY